MKRSLLDADLNDECKLIKYSKVAPWKNRDEFEYVFNLLFVSTDQNKLLNLEKVFDLLSVWKLRMKNFTPAAIHCTLAIIEVNIRDFHKISEKLIPQLELNQLKAFYSNTFTRFINHMSSIMQSGQFRTMYSTARKLGIESFLIDLRHLCAHGQAVPSLELFRRTTDYCMQWLKQFYWERILNTITDAHYKDIRLKDSLEFEENIQELIKMYDFVSECVWRKCKHLSNCENVLSANEFHQLEYYINEHYRSTNRLNEIQLDMIRDIGTLITSQEHQLSKHSKIFCDLLFHSRYFIETSAKFGAKDDTNKSEKKYRFVKLHESLFRAIVICGFSEIAFNSLLNICEDLHEDMNRRQAAGLWAREICRGFIVFKEFKKMYKIKKDQNKNIHVDVPPANLNEEISIDVINFYKEINVNQNEILIFGDTIRRPWSLSFKKNYLLEHLLRINEITINILKECLLLADPEFGTEERSAIIELMDAYIGNNIDKASSSNKEDNDLLEESNRIYSVELDLLKTKTGSDVMNSTINEQGEKRYGIWSEVSDDINWPTYPLGVISRKL